MATKTESKREVRELRAQIHEVEAAIKTLPKWTQAYQSKGELFLALKAKLRDLEGDPEDLTRTPPPLEFTRGNPESELAAINKRLGILGDEVLTDTYIEHRAELRERRDYLEERLPYLGVTDEDLAAQVEDAEIQLESAQEERMSFPKGSKRAEKAARLAQEAAASVAALTTEAGHRRAQEEVRGMVEHRAQTEAKRLATEAWRASTETQIKEMTAAGAQQWEIDKIRTEQGGPPPDDLVAEFADDLRAELRAAHPIADPSVAI